MLGILGLGGAGGNIADEAAKYGFHTAAINFSQRDLDSLENVKAKLRLIGSEGVGHNRDEAIQLLSEHYDVAINFIKEQFGHSSVEIIAFTFSTGGGSGSGISPILMDICSNLMPDKVFVAMPIIPDYSEVVMNQINCVKTFEELSRLSVCVLPVDNQRVRVIYPSVGKNLIYENANTTVIHLLKQLIEYTDKNSKDGVFDKKDFKTVLGTKGIGIIAEVDINKTKDGKIDISKQGITRAIHSSWDSSIFAPIEYDKVIRSAVIFDAPESMMQFLDYQLIFESFGQGAPLDLFEGNYHECQSGKVITVLTGLKWCHSRLEIVEKIIQEGRMKIENALSDEENYESRSSELASMFRSQSPKQKNVKSVSDILSKYRR